MANKKLKTTSVLSLTSGLLVALMSLAVCGISVYMLVVSSGLRSAIGESVSDIKLNYLCNAKASYIRS